MKGNQLYTPEFVYHEQRIGLETSYKRLINYIYFNLIFRRLRIQVIFFFIIHTINVQFHSSTLLQSNCYNTKDIFFFLKTQKALENFAKLKEDASYGHLYIENISIKNIF